MSFTDDVEITLVHIQEKIASLSSRVDSQLLSLEDTILTETLRGSLRGCITMISQTLGDLEKIEDKDNAIFDWFNQKKKLIKKRTQLENMLQASGKLDLEQARAEIGDDDSGSQRSGTLSGKKRDRSDKQSASSLFSEGSGKRSIGERDKSQKGSVWDLQFGLGGANDLLAKLDEVSESDSDDESSSTDDLERALSARDDKSAKDDLLSLLGDDDDSSGDDSDDSSSSEELDELSALLSAPTSFNVKRPNKAKSDLPVSNGSAFDLFRFAGEKPSTKRYLGSSGTEIIDESKLTKAHGESADTNVEGYRRKKKKGRYFAFGDNNSQYEMQDSHTCVTSVVDNANIYCVFDGHSKADCSTKLKETFPDILKRTINRIGLSNDLTAMWDPLFEEVDNNLKEFEESGATGTTVLVWEHEGKKYIQSANVGDSFSFLYRGGTPIWLSTPHRLSNPEEKQRLIDLGEEIAPNQTRICGLNVTRVFGDHFGKSVGVGIIGNPFISPVFELNEEDTHMIVASDGLWDVLDEVEAWDLIRDVEDAQDMSTILMKTAMRNPECQDNITVVVVKL